MADGEYAPSVHKMPATSLRAVRLMAFTGCPICPNGSIPARAGG